MPDYRLYRLDAADRIKDVVAFTGADDDAAVAEALRIDHAYVVEIWSGARLVTRVPTGGGDTSSVSHAAPPK